jgi:hypothetical protein
MAYSSIGFQIECNAKTLLTSKSHIPDFFDDQFPNHYNFASDPGLDSQYPSESNRLSAATTTRSNNPLTNASWISQSQCQCYGLAKMKVRLHSSGLTTIFSGTKQESKDEWMVINSREFIITVKDSKIPRIITIGIER